MLVSSSRKHVREVVWDRQLLEKGHAILVSVLHWQFVDLWKRVKKKVATLWPHKRSLYRRFGGSKAQSSLSAVELRFSCRSRKHPRWSFLENCNTKTMTAIFWCGCWCDIRDFVPKPPKTTIRFVGWFVGGWCRFLLQGNKAQVQRCESSKSFPSCEVLGASPCHDWCCWKWRDTHDARSAYNFIAKFLMR